MPKLRLHLTFPETLIQEPIIWRLGRQYDIITNIRRANVEESVGWIILEVEGAEEALEGGIDWMKEMGVQVDRLASGEGGSVCERDEFAADDEGVADVDAGADHDQEREREQQSGDQHRAALVPEPAL